MDNNTSQFSLRSETMDASGLEANTLNPVAPVATTATDEPVFSAPPVDNSTTNNGNGAEVVPPSEDSPSSGLVMEPINPAHSDEKCFLCKHQEIAFLAIRWAMVLVLIALAINLLRGATKKAA